MGKGWDGHSWHRVPLLRRLVAGSLGGVHCQGTGPVTVQGCFQRTEICGRGGDPWVLGSHRKERVTGFLTVGVTGSWALGLVLFGWPKQTVALPCPLTFP